MTMCMYKICVTNRQLAGIKENAYLSDEYLMKLERALQRKPNALILREKDLSESEYEELAAKVIKLCKSYDVQCILNKYVNAAVRLEADCVQLSMKAFAALTGEEKKQFQKIGVSVHSVDEAVLAECSGADFVIAGHIFSTDCKKGVPPRGVEFLHAVCQAVSIPVYAIGGIHDNNAKACVEAGASGVCMMSEYMKMG